MILLNCIIDGNYLLHRHVHTLHKNNLLFGGLEKSLDVAISNYRKWYPFANIFFVSDTKKKSWRSKFAKTYKTKRKKKSEIDWEFVYSTYEDFKKKLVYKKIKLFELDHIEGDDWVSFICAKTNSVGQSNLIVSNDYDIKQIIKFSLDPLWINFMTNEFFNKQKFFLPNNYKLFTDKVSQSVSTSIFEMNDDSEFLNYMNEVAKKYEITEIDHLESLLIKVISGDISDNISSVHMTGQSGRKRGIGKKGAESILEMYKQEFGDPMMNDPDLIENIADLICEKKKLNRSYLGQISENIKKNLQMINLDVDRLPKEVVDRMKTISF